MDELLHDFLAETGDHLEAAGEQLVFFEKHPTDASDIGAIFRLVHTIKGTCGFIGLPRLERLAHNAETLVSQLRDGVPSTRETVSLILATVDRIKFILDELAAHAVEPSGSDEDLIAELLAATGTAERDPAPEPATFEATAAARQTAGGTDHAPVAASEEAAKIAANGRRHDSIRVAVSLLDALMTLVSELVLARNQLAETSRRVEEGSAGFALGRLSQLLSELQDTVMRARMQPLGRLFASFPRLARELGRELDKSVELLHSGADTELDRQLIELVRDPLTHVIRNCADHGIEPPAERLAAGKPETGTIRVTASQESGSVVIRVSDDGRGLDIAGIRKKALAMGLASAAEIEGMSDGDVCRFIFAPRFSTAPSLTTVSGRGMGMDIVRRNIEAAGGSIEIATRSGRGTSFAFKIPLTLAIAPALIVAAGADRFALPQHVVSEIVQVVEGGATRIDRIGEALLIHLRGETLPVCDLRELLRLHPGASGPPIEFVVLVKAGQFRFGLVVDGILGAQDIVVKPLMPVLGAPDVFSGNTILGDGSVVLIFDTAAIARRLDPRRSDESVAAVAPEESRRERDPTSLILFRAGKGPAKAVPLTLVTRIEMVEDAAIARIDAGLVTVRDGHVIPLVHAGGADVEATPLPTWPVLMVGVSGELMGIVATEIIDIVTEQLSIEVSSRSPGLVGLATIAGQAVEVLDITHFMKLARPEAFARGRNRRARVLLVEDKPFFRDLLAPAVFAAGYEVVMASGAHGALATLRSEPPFDAVVTDTEMPGMSGYALARALRADQRFATIPVFGLASVIAQAVRDAASAAGMREVVGKLDRIALVDALAAALDAGSIQSFALERRILSGEAA